MTLEEQLKDILGLADVPDDSNAEFTKWKNAETAEQDFYDYIHDLNPIHPYHKSEHGIRLRVARELIKTQVSIALLSSSSYVRKLAELISKEDDKEWLVKTYGIYYMDKMMDVFKTDFVRQQKNKVDF